MTRRTPVWRTRTLGLAVLGLLGLVLLVSYDKALPLIHGNGGRLLRAAFVELNDVNGSTPVRIDGVNVGTVDSVARGHGQQTILQMSITNPKVRVTREATITVRYRTILGGSVYIDLNPGPRGAPPLGNRILPAGRTSMQVEFDDFTNTFNPTARRGLGQMLHGESQGLSDPADLDATLHQIGPALSTLGTASEALRGTDIGDLPRLVRGSATTLTTVSTRLTALSTLIKDGERDLAVTALHRRALGEGLALAPAALAAVRATAGPLDHTLGQLDTLAVALRPGAARLAPAITELQPTLVAADELLDETPPLTRAAPNALSGLVHVSRTAVPLIAAITPALTTFNDGVLPFLNARDNNIGLRNYETLGPLVSAVDSALGEYDANGHIVKETTLYLADTVLLPCDIGALGQNLSQCHLLNDILTQTLTGDTARRTR